MTVFGVDATFKASFSGVKDFLGRIGPRWGTNSTTKYTQFAEMSADFAFTKTWTGGSYSFIGIYGWSTNPLVEYYIVDDWFGSRSSPGTNSTNKGTLVVDGGTYDIYVHTQTNQPSISGTQTFMQYFSIRQTARACGHISISEHFKKWASLNMPLGNLYESSIVMEAGGGATGSIDFTTATVTTQ
jgi:endo-1,4-beta-xylanase